MVWLGLQDEDDYVEDSALQTHSNNNLNQSGANQGSARVEETVVTTDGHYDEPQEPTPQRARPQQAPTLKVARPATIRPASQNKNSVSIRSKVTQNSVNVVEPKGFNDAQQIGDCLKEGKPVIVNLQHIPKDLQRRLIDFSSGLTYGLEGSMSRVAENVFLLAPNDVEVSEEEKENLNAQGLYSL